MKKIPFKLILLTVLVTMGMTAQRLETPLQEYKVSSDAAISVSASYAEIEIQEWSKNKVEIYGVMDVQGLPEEEAQSLFDSWDISTNGLEWIFYLRKDVKWSDGEAFDADDVIFTFNDCIFNEDIPGVGMRDLLKVEGKLPVVEKIDDFTVKIVLPSPYAPFARMVGGVWILPEHILRGSVESGEFASTWNVDTDPKDIVGTGPYVISEYRSGEKLIQSANPHYWRRDKDNNRMPKVEKRTILIVPNVNTARLKFKSGETDAYGTRGEDYATMIEETVAGNYSIYDCGLDLSSMFIMFNLNKVSVSPEKQVWFRDKNFR